MFFHNAHDRDHLAHLEGRIHRLEATVSRQQQIIAELARRADLPPLEPRDLTPEDTLPDEVRALLDRGREIAAIKRYRELTGAGLRAAKETIDRAQGKG
ncbi:hypothetical protein [Corynebacterium halotolerans]|uniref:Ribosomal protein L7/L12 C-terminal domain-containing protein n=1 Tax=Corynebacterium halotolerans YIM 70093 = DSM 44683 TaxID=1121362 RepID=M1N1E3_9CORY|nr:hypothetical protein [Corynebacterium halotolerans]AGF73744.1 hypothetical protein A605_13740 [Corynebacterium halotolerans YIM 70093 = DSM 44683]